MKVLSPKKLSELTDVSVRTLQYYDKIGLLKASFKDENKFRFYTADELYRLEKIITLKSLGFSLKEITTILDKKEEQLNKLLAYQKVVLDEKLKELNTLRNLIDEIIDASIDKKTLEWQKLVDITVQYNAYKRLEKSWHSKVLNKKELLDFLELDSYAPSNHKKDKRVQLKKEWKALCKKASSLKKCGCNSKERISVGKEILIWADAFFGRQHVKLRNKVFFDGLLGTKINLSEYHLDSETIQWIQDSINLYCKDFIESLLDNYDGKELKAKYNEFVSFIFAGDFERVKRFLNKVMPNQETTLKELLYKTHKKTKRCDES